MKATSVMFVSALIICAASAPWSLADEPVERSGEWSKPMRDLQVRITLVEKSPINGTRSLVPYLELRYVGDSANPRKVRCGGEYVKFELVNADGQVVRDGWSLPRSGPHADPGMIVLPHDSSIRIGMYCSNWGVPQNKAAMISTDSGAWVLTSEEKGRVFLRATVKGAQSEIDADVIWHGEIQAPPLKVDWQR